MEWKGIIDGIFGNSKLSRILQVLATISTWMTGLDRRLSNIEARLGNVEVGLKIKGIDVPPVGSAEPTKPPEI